VIGFSLLEPSPLLSPYAFDCLISARYNVFH
jgi:hypothetical protein